MKKNNSRLWLVMALVFIAVFAMSSFAMAANEINVEYYDASGGHLENNDAATTAAVSGETGKWSVSVSVPATPAAPVIEGYTFKGWAVDNTWGYADLIPANTVQKIKTVSCTQSDSPDFAHLLATHLPGNSISLTATYEAKADIAITLYSQVLGTTEYAEYGTIPNQTFGTTAQLPDSDYNIGDIAPMQEEGYTFIGWQDKATGTLYMENDAGKIMYPITSENPELKTVWVADGIQSVTVRFADAATGVQYFSYSQNVNTNCVVPGLGVGEDIHKEGYTFQKKWINAKNNTDILTAGASYKIIGSATYFADWTANDYAISSTAAYSTLPDLPKTAHAGDRVTFTATPAANHGLTGVTVEDAEKHLVLSLTKLTEDPATGVCTYEFIMPASAVTITVNAQPNVFAISSSVDKVTLGNLAANAKTGGYVTFTATPAAGTQLNNVRVYQTETPGEAIPLTYIGSNGNTMTYGFTMPAAAVTVAANTAPLQHTVTALAYDNTLLGIASVDAGGTLTLPEGWAPGDRGGYTFKGWYNTAIVNGGDTYGDEFIFAVGENLATAVKENIVIKQFYEGSRVLVTNGSDAATTASLATLNVASSYRTLDNKTEKNTGNLLAGTDAFCVSKSGADIRVKVQAKPNYEITGVVAIPAEETATNYIPCDKIEYDSATKTYTYAFAMPARNVKIVVFTEPLEYTVNVTEAPAGLVDGGSYTINGTYSDNKDIAQGKTAAVKVYPLPGYAIDEITASYENTNAEGTVVGTSYCPAVNIADNPVLNRYQPTAEQTEFQFLMPSADVSFSITYKKTGYIIDTATSNRITYPEHATDPLTVQGAVAPLISERGLSTDGPYVNIENAQVGDNVLLLVVAFPGYENDTLNVKKTDSKDEYLTLSPAELDDDILRGMSDNIASTNVSITAIPTYSAFTFRMPADNVTVKATFSKRNYDVKFVDGEKEIKSREVPYLDTPDMAPDQSREGYDFLGWASEDVRVPVTEAAPSKNASDFVIIKDTTINAVYGTHHYPIDYGTLDTNGSFSTDAPENGSFVDANPTAADFGEKVTFGVTPNTGYQIDKVQATYTDTYGKTQTVAFDTYPESLIVGGDYTFTMPNCATAQDKDTLSIAATFKKVEYKVGITVNDEGQGQVLIGTTDTREASYPYQTEVAFMAVPNDGYGLDSVTVVDADGASISYKPDITPEGNIYQFEMPAKDVKVTVTFKAHTYDITYNTPANGTIAPKDEKVAHQATASFTATPAEGYVIDQVVGTYVDGGNVKREITLDETPGTAPGSVVYSFSMPQYPVDIQTSFKKGTYTVDLTQNGEGKILLNQADRTSATADFGSTVTVKVTPKTGWELSKITAVKAGSTDTIALTPAKINAKGGVYTFTMPASNVAVSVDLVKKSSTIDTFSISFTGDAHGTVKATNGDSAEYGDSVTIVSDPDDGWRFQNISVKAADGSYVPVSFKGQDADYVTTHVFTMPENDVEIYVTFTQHAASQYTDVRTDDWFYAATEFVSDRGYFVGTSETLFSPELNMTRAMFVSVLARVAGVDTASFSDTSFTDVEVGSWYAPSVEWATKEGIIKGYGDGTFGPTDDVTREQMTLIMYNFCKWSNYDIPVENPEWMEKYTDIAEISSWAEESVAWAVSTGLIKGNSATTINPLGTATRAEVAQVIKNLCDKIVYE